MLYKNHATIFRKALLSKIEDIKIIIQTYFCHPFSGYIEMNIDANNHIILKIKDTNIDFAYINVEIIKDKNT